MKNPENVIESAWPLLERLRYHRLCLAVSGGADSMSLLCAFARLARQYGLCGQLVVGHVNHGTRGTESDGDAIFVRHTAEQYGLTFEERTIQACQLEEMVQRTGSWENAAREIRYQFLREMAQKNCARYIATAHTKNDQLETIIQRIFRGTGLDGLCAIPRIRPLDDSIVIIRPLLDLDRKEILHYLDSIHQSFRNDSSNQTDAYLRNRIRHDLVPVLEQLFPDRWQNALLRLSQLAEDVTRQDLCRGDLIRQKVIMMQNTTEVIINLSELKKNDSFSIGIFFRSLWKEQKWHLGEMGRSQWQRLCQIATSNKTEQEEFPGNITVKKDDESMSIFECNCGCNVKKTNNS